MGELTADGRSRLLGLAHASIETTVRGDDTLGVSLGAAEFPAELRLCRGAFVTIKTVASAPSTRLGLRGCIGNITSDLPLYRNVIEVAARSAADDPRFPPITPAELGGLHVEISVLSTLRALPRAEELRPGVDGVRLSRDGTTALFLPQVAGERGWSAEHTLGQLAVKAGLPSHAWKDADLQVFTAEVFGDG